MDPIPLRSRSAAPSCSPIPNDHVARTSSDCGLTFRYCSMRVAPGQPLPTCCSRAAAPSTAGGSDFSKAGIGAVVDAPVRRRDSCFAALERFRSFVAHLVPAIMRSAGNVPRGAALFDLRFRRQFQPPKFSRIHRATLIEARSWSRLSVAIGNLFQMSVVELLA
jgi:hypothetical protein